MAGNQFHIVNGQIIDPNGNTFVAHGINIGPQDMTTVAQSGLSTFPGLNFIRLAIPGGSYPDAASLQNFVAQMTAKGVVVEIEDHPYPSPGVYTGGQLQQESNWYASLAAAFKSNPYVWFGTMNEPNTGSYGSSEAAISAQEQATYNAIRGAGSNAVIMNELYGGGNPGTIGNGFGMTPSTYANMTNIVWDFHAYGWDSNYSTDQATVTNALLGSVSGGYGIAAAQTIHSADGVVPVIVGEFGDLTVGNNVDPNGPQEVNAVLNSGYGYAAWTWGGSGGADQLTKGGSLTGFGQQVAAAIKSTASTTAFQPVATTSATPPTTDSTASTTTSQATNATSAATSITNGTSAATTTSAFVGNGTTPPGVDAALWWSSAAAAAWSGQSSFVPPPTTVQSANDTIVLAGATDAITDGAGHKWTITPGGQVAIDGVTDPTTVNVKELAYVKGLVWQENTSALWWSKAGPTAPWIGRIPTSPLPTTIAVPVTPSTVGVTQSNVLVTSPAGDHMMFISGSNDTVALSGGVNTITDSGTANTYVIPAAGRGYDTFTTNVLNQSTKLDLSSALAATTWNGSAATLASYLSVANTAQGAVLSIAPTPGGAAVAVATINGATGVTLAGFLPHAVL